MCYLEVNAVLKQDGQRMYDVTLWRIRLNIFCNGNATMLSLCIVLNG
jgi:hypothetical protein